MKAFRRVQFDKLERGLSILFGKFQDAIEEVILDIQKDPTIDGVVLENVTVGSSNTQIPHGLGRVVRGWYIVRKRANATVWDNQDSNTLPSTYLSLQADTPVVVDIKVF